MKRPLVLVVDDQPALRRLIRTSLAEVECEVAEAEDGESALRFIAQRIPDVVLLDVEMPGIDGYTVCNRIKSSRSTSLIPVLMVSARTDTADRVRGLEVGCDDFITKPFDRAELMARVRSMIRVSHLMESLEEAQQVIMSLARAVEAKDSYTERHIQRVAEMSRSLGRELGLDQTQLDDLYRGGLIHDIGKIGVPDHVLGKASALDQAETSVMQTHPLIGEEIARPLRSASTLLEIIRHHHEHIDGSGYPDGLTGEQIPLSARIVAVCDAFDALVTDRPYRRQRSLEEAIEVLRESAGTQWDAEIVRVFVEKVVPIHASGYQEISPRAS